MATVRASRHGRFEVFILINGKRAQELNASASGCISTYWIESKLDAEFSVNVLEHPTATSAESRVDVFADGIEVGKGILVPGVPCQFLGSWVNRERLRPFVFLETTQDARVSSKYGDKLGSIEVKVSEVVVYNLAGISDPPPPLPGFDHTTRGEERLQHRIGLGAVVHNRRYNNQAASRFTTLSFDPYSPGPVAIFEIFYRPRIVPIAGQKTKKRHSPEDMEVVTKNPSKRPNIPQQISQFNLKQSSLFDTFKISCSRCSEMGKACTRLLGRTACSSCSDKKLGCDLNARTRNLDLQTTLLGSSNTTIGNRMPDPEDIIELTSNSAESDTNGHSSDETYEDQSTSYSQESTRMSRKAKKVMFGNGIERKVNKANEKRISSTVENSRDHPGSSESMDRAIPNMNNSQLPATESEQAKNLLAALRKWSDDLMVFVADGGDSGYVSGVAKDLVKDLEERYRSLQADLLRVKRRK